MYTKLETVKGHAFLTEDGFGKAIAVAVGQAAADLYTTIIASVALVSAGVVTHDNQVVLNVVQDGKQIPVITFDVAQTDVLQNFALGISGAAQTVGFTFQIIPELTRTTFSHRRSRASPAATSA